MQGLEQPVEYTVSHFGDPMLWSEQKSLEVTKLRFNPRAELPIGLTWRLLMKSGTGGGPSNLSCWRKY